MAIWLRWLLARRHWQLPMPVICLSLPVQLLNPPADAVFSPGSLSIVLPHVIGDDIVRSGGGNQYPEQFETGVERHPEELYRLALHDLVL